MPLAEYKSSFPVSPDALFNWHARPVRWNDCYLHGSMRES